MRNPAHAIRHLHACIMVGTADCDAVLELGCGLGDKLAMCQGSVRDGVDAHLPYLRWARRHWGHHLHALHHRNVIGFVEDAIIQKKDTGQTLWDAVILVDFLEHLTKAEGRRLLFLCKRFIRRRVLVFCPEGYYPQKDDCYNMGGEQWQAHRSAWEIEDLEARGFDVVRWEDQHGAGKHALFAMRSQP